MKRIVLASLSLLYGPLCVATSSYQYPIHDPLAATVIGTPSEFAAVLPKTIPRKDMNVVVFPDRPLSKFIPYKVLNYTLVAQDHVAPLIFTIAGTGASQRSPKMLMLEKAFYQAGFHVVSLPSPTYANFITTASSTEVPGHVVRDGEDLYRVMDLIYKQIKDKVKVSEFYVTGYSLGGAEAAFVAKLDDERHTFNFKNVLLINPPVNLFTSVSILDHMLEDNIPGGPNHFDAFFNDLMRDFTKKYAEDSKLEKVDFNDDFLYRIYEDEHGDIDPHRVAALIGMSFRLSSSNMIFTSDMMTNGGYILPKNHVLEPTESTTGYFKVAARTSFEDYFHDVFYPYFHALDKNLTEAELIHDTSLKSIEGYLRSTDKISVVHNEDDVILAPGEINFFRDVFGSRAHIYPHGGHCGNMAYRDNVAYMIDYFTQGGHVDENADTPHR